MNTELIMEKLFMETMTDKIEERHMVIPSTFTDALRLAAEIQDQLDAAQLKIETNKTKVEFATLVEGSNNRCIRLWVMDMQNYYNLSSSERDVFKWLVDNKYIYRVERSYLPYSKYEANGMGYFCVNAVEANGIVVRQVSITGKGIIALTGKVIDSFNTLESEAA